MCSTVVPCFKMIPYSDKRGKAPAVGKGAELIQIRTYKMRHECTNVSKPFLRSWWDFLCTLCLCETDSFRNSACFSPCISWNKERLKKSRGLCLWYYNTNTKINRFCSQIVSKLSSYKSTSVSEICLSRCATQFTRCAGNYKLTQRHSEAETSE